jgi:N-acetylmuramoyl-L-alanine amidase
VEVHLTRSSDKQVLLADRVAIADKIHPDCFISLHVNDRKNDDPAKGNFDIITVDNGLAEQNKKLAKSIFENMVQVGGVQKSTISSGHKLYVLSHNSAPSVLLELGDIKDAAQMATIKDDTKLDALCSAILKGVVESRK